VCVCFLCFTQRISSSSSLASLASLGNVVSYPLNQLLGKSSLTGFDGNQQQITISTKAIILSLTLIQRRGIFKQNLAQLHDSECMSLSLRSKCQCYWKLLFFFFFATVDDRTVGVFRISFAELYQALTFHLQQGKLVEH
jgi:hypothetical protein